MSLTKRVGLVVGAAALSLTGTALGGTSEANDQDLRARIAQMEAELAKLQAQSGEQWLTETRASEIRALVNDVLMDADTRASLLQDGGTAGWDDSGFFLSSADGNNRLEISGLLQIRWMKDLQDHGDDDTSTEAFEDEDESRGGFENTRTKLIFEGNVLSPANTYRVEGDFGQFGSFGLKDAWFRHTMDNGWYIQAGQFKGPYLREELMDAGNQLAVERSLVNYAFTTRYTQGIMLGYQGDSWSFQASFNDGGRAANAPALVYDTEYSFDARAQIKTAGTWDQFNDFTSWRSDDFGMLIGVAGHFQRDESGTAAGSLLGTGDEIEVWGITADVSIEGGGWNGFGAIVYNDIQDDTIVDLNPWGFVAQGGIFLNDSWELFGRYETGDHDVDGGLTFQEEDLNILTVGLTKYWNQHGLKWTTDFGWAFDSIDPVWTAVTGGNMALTGWRGDSTDDGDQMVFRSQLQVKF